MDRVDLLAVVISIITVTGFMVLPIYYCPPTADKDYGEPCDLPTGIGYSMKKFESIP